MAKEFTASNGVEFRLEDSPGGAQVQWRTGPSMTWERVGRYNLTAYSKVSQGLREYFDLLDNPPEEPKPWLDAKVGEVWDMETTQGEDYRVAVAQTDFLTYEMPEFIRLETGDTYDLDDPIFTGGAKVFG